LRGYGGRGSGKSGNEEATSTNRGVVVPPGGDLEVCVFRSRDFPLAEVSGTLAAVETDDSWKLADMRPQGRLVSAYVGVEGLRVI
jgi:hypothetical protein